MTQGIEMGFVSLVHPSVGMFEGLWREGLGISEPSWGQRRAVSCGRSDVFMGGAGEDGARSWICQLVPKECRE